MILSGSPGPEINPMAVGHAGKSLLTWSDSATSSYATSMPYAFAPSARKPPRTASEPAWPTSPHPNSAPTELEQDDDPYLVVDLDPG